jgi:hypothetical protein
VLASSENVGPCLAAATAVEKASKPAETRAGALRAGAAIADITPKQFPMSMVGGFSPIPARGAHDPFHARALVLANGDLTLAIVVVDNLGLSQDVADAAKALASKQCGIDADRILLCATHTHSGPPVGGRGGSDPVAAYREQLIAGIADAVVRAHAALQPAAVGHAAHPLAEEVFNRRWYLKPGKMPPNPFGQLDQVKMNPENSPEVLDRPAGPTDPDIAILSVQSAKRRPLAFLASYSFSRRQGNGRTHDS